MPITDTGYDVESFREILERLRSDLETNLGTPISTDPDTIIGILNSIIASEKGLIENDTQAIINNLSIFTAEGIYLDELVSYIGISRRPASTAAGSLKVWRSGEGNIPSDVVFQTTAGEQFVCSGGVTHLLTACAEVLLTPANVAEGSVHTVTINGTLFSYTAVVTDTATEVTDYFVTEIANVLSLTTENSVDSLRFSGTDEDLNSLSVAFSNFTLTEVATFNFCESLSAKSLVVTENTITEVVTNNPNILRSNNPLPFVDGADLETDEELRARHQLSVQLGGNATVPAIVAKLLQVVNVTQAYIIENRTLLPDGDGRPAKSYETYVVGGDPSAVGQAIWDSKPAGVETTGDILTGVTDGQGNIQSVYWSRPEPIYIFLRVTYKKYDEESFPTDGEAGMADALKAYGDSLDIGEDVIPTRFIGTLYQAITGLDVVTVEVGSSTNIGDTSPASGYLTSSIDITNAQASDFALARITLVETV